MSPPHESATASGWGAMKTWVMAAGVYGRVRASGVRSRVPPGLADERHEHARAVRPLAPLGPVALHHDQLLLASRADRDHQAPPLTELLAQRIGNSRRASSDHDPVPRRPVRRAERPVAGPHLDEVPVPESREPLGGRCRQVRLALDRGHAAPELREDRGLVPGARPDVEHAGVGHQLEQLGHSGDHVWLADRLPGPDRQGCVLVRLGALLLGHERLTRNGGHGREDARVLDVSSAELRLDHPRPGLARAVRALVHRSGRQLAAGLAGGLADTAGDGPGETLEDGLAATDELGDADGDTEALDAGDSLTSAVGVAVVAGNSPLARPLWPKSRAYAKIATNTPTIAITNQADARSSTWTARSETDGAAAAAGAAFPGVLRPRRAGSVVAAAPVATAGAVSASSASAVSASTVAAAAAAASASTASSSTSPSSASASISSSGASGSRS